MCVARWPQLELTSKEVKKNDNLERSCCYGGKFLSGQMTNVKGVKRHMPLNPHQFMSALHLA